MRRVDREVTAQEGIEAIIGECKVCRIAMMDDEGLYIVPLNFGYEYKDGVYSLYFHSAKEGRKVDALNQNPNVAFEMDCGHALIEREDPASYSYRYKSVIGNGIMHLLTDLADKRKAMYILMMCQTGRDFIVPDKALDTVNIYKLVVKNLTGKQNV